jgi:hypothetical protein
VRTGDAAGLTAVLEAHMADAVARILVPAQASSSPSVPA